MVDVEFTEDDVQSLADKLSAFVDTLEPGERAVFEVVEWQLAMNTLSEEEDVAGFIFVNPDRLGNAQRHVIIDDALRAAESGRTHQFYDADGKKLIGNRQGLWKSMIEMLISLRNVPATPSETEPATG